MRRSFPVIGHLRYIFESLRPELRPYFIASDQERNLISREKRLTVDQRAEGQLDTGPTPMLIGSATSGSVTREHLPKHSRRRTALKSARASVRSPIAGLRSPADLGPEHSFRRVAIGYIRSLAEIYSRLEARRLLSGTAFESWGRMWDEVCRQRF